MNRGWVGRWKAGRQNVAQHLMRSGRSVSFSLGLQFLQEGPVTVVDVGCGLSDFASMVQKKNPLAITYCLDGQPATVGALRKQGYNARIYRAPERLPFSNGEIEFLHCSHLIEHLQPQELYFLLQEISRTLASKGVLVISAPTLWEGFYSDLSHVRPYSEDVLNKYLTSDLSRVSNTRRYIRQFRREALFYRYEKLPIFGPLGFRGHTWLVDLIVLGVKKAMAFVGVYRLITTGYTAVYRKM